MRRSLAPGQPAGGGHSSRSMSYHCHQEFLMADSLVNDHQRGHGAYLAVADRDAFEDPTYVLGRSDTETRRLMLQAELYGHVMERFFRDAGVCQGMTVLDVGCGA